jgi:hypothetical protein
LIQLKADRGAVCFTGSLALLNRGVRVEATARKVSPRSWMMGITVVAVAVLLTPSQARADCHRQHAESEHAVSMTTSTTDDGETAAAEPAETADHAQGLAATRESSEGRLASAPCSGSCHPGGAGCCAAWLAPALLLASPLGQRSVSDWTVARGAGVTPDVLPEPPRVLA